MKNTKTALVVVCAILLVAASVMGTLAYLTDTTDEVKNTFSVGKVVITLDEAKINENGEPVDKDGNVVDKERLDLAVRVTANTYDMIPGHTYTKDPTIHVATDSEKCYLFVTIDNGIASVENTIAGQLARTDTDACKWLPVGGYTNLYYYAYVSGTSQTPYVNNSGSHPIVFKTITIDADATYAQLEALKNAKIEINAYAVQVDGFEDKTAAEIWAAAFAGQTTAAKPVTSTPET